MRKHTRLIFALLAFLVPFSIYLLTLSPTYIPSDSAEYAMCMHYLGICHPPGFFLYIFTGFVFTYAIPFGSLIYKANLLSAVFGSAAILFVYLSLFKLSKSKFFALSLALLLSVTNTFWQYSVAADVFTFGAFLLALSIFLVLTKKQRLSFFVLGLLTSHLYITIFMLPITYWYFWGTKLKLRTFITTVFIFTAGLFPFLLLYLRMAQNPVINWGHVNSFSDYINFILRKEFGSLFLLNNPLLNFSISNLLKQTFTYMTTISLEFALIPLAVIPFYKKVEYDKNFYFLLASIFSIVVFQLITLSTIDPYSNFMGVQINKFFVLSMIPLTLLLGLTLYSIVKNYMTLEGKFLVILSLLAVLVFALNISRNNESDNVYFQQLVNDSLSALPNNSLVLTSDHDFFYGSLYEQKIQNKYTGITLLYFPNENNTDAKSYYPQLFSNEPDFEFMQRIISGPKLNNVEQILLEPIVKNQDKQIFIIQSSINKSLFQFIRPQLSPYGLWWKYSKEQNHTSAADLELSLEELKDRKSYAGPNHLSENNKLQTYSTAFGSLAFLLVSEGKHDEAIRYFNLSLEKNPNDKSIPEKIKIVKNLKKLEPSLQAFIANKDANKLLQLAMHYYYFENYQKAALIYQEILKNDPTNAQIHSNLASSYAKAGEYDKAKQYFIKALEIDPGLKFAKEGLAKFEK